MHIEVLEGSFGKGGFELSEQGFASPGLTVLFDDIAEITAKRMSMEHNPLKAGKPAMAASLLFGRPAWAISSNAWTGNTLAITFYVRTHKGEEFMAKTDSDTFTRITALYLGEAEA